MVLILSKKPLKFQARSRYRLRCHLKGTLEKKYLSKCNVIHLRALIDNRIWHSRIADFGVSGELAMVLTTTWW
jgi:hypothetical protein